jgi:hypothetical protein
MTSESKNLTDNNNFEQASFQTTDMPNTPVPEGIYVHTFEKINNLREDMWPVFVVNKKKAVMAVLSSDLFHEPSCNNNVLIGNDGYSISNARYIGFKRCGQTSQTYVKRENVYTKHAAMTDTIYSVNPFRFYVKSYSFSVRCEFAKSLNYNESEGVVDIFQIDIQTWTAEVFGILIQLYDRNIRVVYGYNNTIIAHDTSFFENSFGLKKLIFSFEVNAYFNTIKLELFGLDDNKSISHLFENIIFYHNPFVVLGMTDQAIVESTIS